MFKLNYYLKAARSEDALLVLKKQNPGQYQKELNRLKPIILSVVFRKQRLIVSTGKKASQRFWDNAKQSIKNLKEAPANAQEVNEWLVGKKSELEKELKKLLRQHKSINRNVLKSLINDCVELNNDLKTWEVAINQFLSEQKTGNGDRLKLNTIKNYKVLINHIAAFQENSEFHVEAVNNQWVANFKEYLCHTKGLHDNSICKYMRALKAFITACNKKGVYFDVDLKEIKTTEKQSVVNILTLEEIMLLKNHHFEVKEHEVIRDIFLFQCFTGQRFSDVMKITWDEIVQANGLHFWDLSTTKTNAFIKAPLSKEALSILEKYKGLPYPLPRRSNQFFNKELKQVGRQVGLVRRVKTIEYRNNIKKECHHFLWEILSSHMARKSFISNSLQLGIPERAVREVPGHKDEKSFKRYVNLGNTHFTQILDTWNRVIQS